MNNVVKIKRDGQESEVLEQYLDAFIKDGWVRVADSGKEESQRNKDIIEKEKEDQLERDRLIAKGRLAEQRENEEALARIEAEKQEAEERRNDDVKQQQARNMLDVKKEQEVRVLGSEDKDEIAQYIEETFGKKLDKRGDLDKVQEKALAIIEEHYEVVKSK